LYQGEIVGLPLQAPWVDVRSIGAGGGSIAVVDAGGLLRVGPRSAGASPGPAGYGRGGEEPTVTDAALALGMLADGAIAGDVPLHAGNFSAWGLLDVDLSQTASRTQITRLSDGALAGAAPLVAELLAEVDARPRPPGTRQVSIHADLRYVGQEHTLTVAAPQD